MLVPAFDSAFLFLFPGQRINDRYHQNMCKGLDPEIADRNREVALQRQLGLPLVQDGVKPSQPALYHPTTLVSNRVRGRDGCNGGIQWAITGVCYAPVILSQRNGPQQTVTASVTQSTLEALGTVLTQISAGTLNMLKEVQDIYHSLASNVLEGLVHFMPSHDVTYYPRMCARKLGFKDIVCEENARPKAAFCICEIKMEIYKILLAMKRSVIQLYLPLVYGVVPHNK